MKKLLKITTFTGALGLGGVYYNFSELRENPQELLVAAQRLGRISFTAGKIAFNSIGGVDHQKHVENSEMLREALKKNGGSYIKLGQVIGNLDLLVPQEYVDTMKPLMNDAPRAKFEDVKRIVEEDLKQPIHKVFAEFDEEPIASASLAQVHRAKLNNGEVVAVKVQHRWIREQYPGDVRILEVLAKTGKKLFKDFDYMWIIDDLKRSAEHELDFIREGNNAQKCSEIFKKNPYVKVPEIYWGLCSDRVLTMEFMEGVIISKVEQIKETGIDLSDLTQLLSKAFNEMIFVSGFVHCDPHPGNILVRPLKTWKGVKPQIVLLDHGLYRDLSEGVKQSYNGMWRSIILQDEEGMKHYAAELGVTTLYPLLAGMMAGRPWEDIMKPESGLERLRNARAYKAQKEELIQHAQEWHKEINQVLGRMHNELVLLFKTFEWLRAIDAELGNPVNTMQIIADYCTRDQVSYTTRYWARLKLWVLSVWISFLEFCSIA